MITNNENLITQWIPDTEIVGALISYIHRSTQKKFAKVLAPYNIGEGHFIILMLLYAQGGRSQDELALLRGYDKTLIAKSVVKLEEEGLIYRLTDPDDKRIKRLYLSESGCTLCPEIESIGFDIDDSLIKNFTEKESRVLIELLQKVALNASEM